MTTFVNKILVALGEPAVGANAKRYEAALLDGEAVLAEYKTVRDCLVLTSKRIMSIDVQGITGKKVEIFSLPYAKITAYSVETAGTFDLDAEFKVWASGLGMMEFKFIKGTDIAKVNNILGNHTM
ncbi:PH domain-containing protein [Candidatus Thiothrix sp. Deng01]|uniref:PH domain-containing protein n=1 Tax=Candidatus Thiothrix phosphatis TaxID=3112415 RepID=A0ABU6CZ00_9GAMM|nr:PH domain-containing protein [Candidatus Thiothrix sp. Deng01]MEB4592061.1 PH domain-containing protein [Candidatus Thiothrix sp. Deng01]